MLAAIDGTERYPRDILREASRLFGRDIPAGSLYTTLERMEKKGLVTSRWGSESSPKTARRRYYKLTPAAIEKLRERQALIEHALKDQQS